MTSQPNAEWRQRWEAVIQPSYRTPPIVLVRGEGCRVWDAEGRAYLDLIAGIATSALGHNHPSLVAAVTGQVSQIAHTSNLFINQPSVRLAEKLVGLLGHGDAKVFLCNDGATANEAALKVVRRRVPDRKRYVAAQRGFHGRTLGALSLTGKDSIRLPFAAGLIDVTFVPFGDADALTAAVDDDVAAVFLEPTLGEGGVVPAPDGYLKAARKACDNSGSLLVLDEIQSGIGRTGSWFAHHRESIVPDVVTLAKGLGGGLPIGACIAIGDNADALQSGDHGSTFGGNPVSAAAALAVIETIESNGLLTNVTELGEHLAAALARIEHELLLGVRGIGLWQALVVRDGTAPAVEAASRSAGFLVNAVAPDAIRLAPPLILTKAEADTFLTALPSIMDAALDATRVAS